MYSNKENINILTSLLVEWGVSDAVVCPGSRNAPIVHNLKECGRMRCVPVTDERSAAFCALGLALATGRPTVVCVTSGSALLNTAPAVAEAFYRHVPLIVVSADRPQQWIDQLDGQTLPQPDALGRFVRRAVSLPEPCGDEQRWYCSRLVNEALHCATCRMPSPVHINVPISEPLFTFDVAELPKVRRWSMGEKVSFFNKQIDLFERFYSAHKPLIVIGQMAANAVMPETIRSLSEHFVVFAEPLANSSYTSIHFDEAVRSQQASDTDYLPDYIIYVGDTLVSKPARRWLRWANVPSCLITPDALDIHDPLTTLEDIVECAADDIDLLLSDFCDIYDEPEEQDAAAMAHEASRREFHARWQSLLCRCARHAEDYEPSYSQMAVARYFEQQLEDIDTHVYTHYANSTAIRLACIYANHYVWCNRGVNGIEGSLSTAAGFSLATDGITVCVIGDLSFFYDQNALWNSSIGGNLRILLLNNSEGGIFKMLPGLDKSGAAHDFVAAAHHTTAEGICAQNDVGYLSAHNMDEMQIGVVTLLTRETKRPLLLEAFTDAEEDARAMKEYFEEMKKKELMICKK